MFAAVVAKEEGGGEQALDREHVIELSTVDDAFWFAWYDCVVASGVRACMLTDQRKATMMSKRANGSLLCERALRRTRV